MIVQETNPNFLSRSANKKPFVLLTFIIFLFSGCIQTDSVNNPSSNVQYYTPGTPYFSLGAVGRYDEEQKPEVQVYLKLPYNNLIFKRNPANDTYNAKVQIRLELYRLEETKNQEVTKSFVQSIDVKSYQETQSYNQFQFDHLFDVQPGQYELNAVLVDKNSEQSILKKLRINVPTIREDSFIVSDIQLMSNTKKDTAEYTTAEVSYNVSPTFNSLRTELQMVVPNSNNNLNVRMYLLKLESDTLPARLPYDATPNRGSLQFKGINYKKADTLQNSFRKLEGITGLLKIDFPLPKLSYGNYEIEIITRTSSGVELFRKDKEFAIKEESYPRIDDVKEMAQALKYIMDTEEYEEMMSHQTGKELKFAFDKFWLTLYENEPMARRMIKTYYSRVEEANKLFPSFKEGWKTDRGMIYIVMGEPIHTEENGDELIWYYPSNNPQYGSSIFYLFKKVSPTGSPYEHYVLQRGMGYEWIYRLAVERWRSGKIN